MPPPKNKSNTVTYQQQVQMGLVKAPVKGFRPASDLGLATTQPERRQATITRIEQPTYIEPAEQRVVQSTKPTVSGTHRDKAEGFLLSVLPLSGALAVAVALLAASLGIVPILSLWILAIIFSVFSLAMVAAYTINQVVSPDGVGLASEVLRHKRLMAEQDRLYNIMERNNE